MFIPKDKFRYLKIKKPAAGGKRYRLN